MDSPPREKALRVVKELRHPDMRICFSNPPEVNIQTVLEPLASRTLSGQEAMFVITLCRSLSQMRTCGDGDSQLVGRKKLMGKVSLLVVWSVVAHNMTQVSWIVCQLDTPRRCFLATLNELPVSLGEIHERILLGIDRERGEHAICLFQCLAFSRRPLCAKELAEVLAIQPPVTLQLHDFYWNTQRT